MANQPQSASQFLTESAANKCSLDQLTLNPDGPYQELDLNEQGTQLLADTLKKVQDNQFKDTLEDWNFRRVKSGSDLAHGRWCAFDDRVVDGRLVTGDKEVTTSIIRLIGEGWILTCSGSLYRLGQKKD